VHTDAPVQPSPESHLNSGDNSENSYVIKPCKTQQKLRFQVSHLNSHLNLT